MVTVVEVDDDAKSRLEELQAEIHLQTGRKVSQQELLTRLIDDAYESRDDLVDSFQGSFTQLSNAETDAMFDVRFNSGSRPTRTTSTTSSTNDCVDTIDRLLNFDDDFDGIVDRLDPKTVA